MSLTEKLLFVAFGFLIIIFIAVGVINKSDKLKMLKEKYDEALQGNDRAEAIAAGEAYYRSLRGGEMSIEDERRILRDVAHLPEPEVEGRDDVSWKVDRVDNGDKGLKWMILFKRKIGGDELRGPERSTRTPGEYRLIDT